MPCERELKHLLNLVNAVTAPHRHGQPVSKRRLDDLANAQVEYEESLAACDESPCVWEMVGGRVLRPSCLGENPHVMWSMWSHGNMTYCPHCGRKIAPLPAAPEVGNV